MENKKLFTITQVAVVEAQSNMWPEISLVKDQCKRELILDGKAVSDKIEKGGLDEEIYELKELHFLRISETCLSKIDPKISLLAENLTDLVLHHNKLSSLPDSVGDLVKLKLVDLSWNEFGTFPQPLCSLENLLTLNISQNQIETIPVEVSGMANLHELYVSGNKLSSLPDSLSKLELLATLQADHNRIAELPGNVSEIRALKALHLFDNVLTDLPASLVLLDKLKLLDLRGNKFKDRRLLKLANVEQTQPKGVFKHLKPIYDKECASGELDLQKVLKFTPKL